jgi:hypothetical protein
LLCFVFNDPYKDRWGSIGGLIGGLIGAHVMREKDMVKKMN